MNSKIILIITGLFLNQIALSDTKLVIETQQGTVSTWSNEKYSRA